MHPPLAGSASKMFRRNGAHLRNSWLFTFAIIFLCEVATGQIPKTGNAFFGYSYSQGQVLSDGASGSINTNGWEGSVEGKLLPWLGVVADLDWHYGDRTLSCTKSPTCTSGVALVTGSRHNFLIGPRASTSIGRYTPFVQVLIGASIQTNSGAGTTASDTSFATAFGGGVDYKVLKGVALRGQIDSIHASLFGRSGNDVRVSTGVVFKF
jgi:opacity protein-like surface antigen